MTDSNQAIYDAVRSRISNGDIGDAVERAIRDANISHYFMLACDGLAHAADDMGRPSVLFRPNLSRDGDQYCVLYGTNLQEGCAGFGDTVAAAMADFDINWRIKVPIKCEHCNGTGAIDTPYSGSDPACPDCDGEGVIYGERRGAVG